MKAKIVAQSFRLVIKTKLEAWATMRILIARNNIILWRNYNDRNR